MISNKTAATLLFITLNTVLVASTTPNNAPGLSPSNKSTPLIRKLRPAPKPREVLKDTNNNINPVEVQGGSTSQGHLAPQRKSGSDFFETLMSRRQYDRVCYFAGRIGRDKFLKRIYPLVKTLEQYNGIVKYLKRHNLVASFYVYGDIEVVKGAIAELRVYGDGNDYFGSGDLEIALPLALEKDRHDRVIELLDVRKGITAIEDEQRTLKGWPPSFEIFVNLFLSNLAPWEDGVALRRFLILRGEELRSKYHGILDTLCLCLVGYLNDKLHLPKAESLLVDIIGQPSLLTHVVFAKQFLWSGDDRHRSVFIKYCWRETIQEGLKTKLYGRGKHLWRVMQTKRPEQFPGKFPSTEEARAAACMNLPTKQQKEEEWIKKNVAILCTKIKDESISNLFPDVLWPIIFEYAVFLVATWNLITPTE